jgi:hypothetical protein
MNELLCHLSNDPAHILCVTEHRLHHEELTSFHVENYVLGSFCCGKSKYRGGVCIFVHNSVKFTSLDIDNYCLYQDFKACAIHPNSRHDKLCFLATYICLYSSPRGNFNTFLTNLLIWLCINSLITILAVLFVETLTLILLMWKIWWAPNNASKWQMGFNSAIKGLMWTI